MSEGPKTKNRRIAHKVNSIFTPSMDSGYHVYDENSVKVRIQEMMRSDIETLHNFMLMHGYSMENYGMFEEGDRFLEYKLRS